MASGTKNNDDNPILNIAVLETASYSPEMSWWHTMLTLTDNTNEDFPNVVRFIHFKNIPAQNNKVIVEAGSSLSNDILNNSEFFTYHTARQSEMMPAWEHALRRARDLERMDLRFEKGFESAPNVFNCRSGIRDLITSVGLRFREDFTMSTAGVHAIRFRNNNIYDWTQPASDSPV